MFIGIDGGGTKTKVVVVDENFELVTFKEYGSFHYMQVGIDGIESIVKNISSFTKAVDTAVFGIPMYGEVKDVDKQIETVIYKYFPNALLVNDVFNGWAGSLACKDGINVVSGTGSIAICHKNNAINIVGGFGHVFGDEGSAYWIGREILSLYSKQLDGRVEKTELFNLISEKEFRELNFGFNSSRDEIAKYAKVCDMAANSSCQFCKQILIDAASELAMLVKSYDENSLVSYSGSVFNSKILKEQFIKNLSNYTVIEPALNPVLGSVLYGYVKENGNANVNEIIEKLKVIVC